MTPELYHEILEWLYNEADILDSRRFRDWYNLLGPEITYIAPLTLDQYENATSDKMYFFLDDHESLGLRIERLYTDFAWAESPPSRTRHHVSNVIVTKNDGIVQAKSNLLLTRSRGPEAGYEWVSCRREDILRRDGDGKWLLAKRVIYLDEVTLSAKNLAFFL